MAKQSAAVEGGGSGCIGLFDSGVGGLTVLREVMRQLPRWDTIYLADSANCPYGARPAEEIRRLSEGISRCLIERGARAIVVACNTASAVALRGLRECFPGVPFVGMVPAIKPAAALTKSGAVGVLATPPTLHGRLLGDAVERYAGGVRVLSQACPGLVERIEEGDLDGPATEALVRRCLEPLLGQGVDVIALGCTHYPFVAPLIQRLAGPEVRLLDPSEAVARQVARVLPEQGSGSGRHVFLTSGEPEALARAVRRLLGLAVQPEPVAWRDGRLG
ncbi:MAG TPA: glutamate racemase [Anaerolineae bacterium]|nr:glutamate racemase [Anaerolineae bacterium]HOQ99719.1 glutamate racemase [Anaerolineae bacterium]HPL26638.1 glutamate racemase [Anaerolineae bacterium]